MGILDYGIIVLFLLAMIFVGWKAGSKNETMDDFILGGRSFNKFALTGTTMATMVGSGMVLGSVGSVYTSGISGTMVWIYGGLALGMVLMGLLAGPIRNMGARSLSETIHFAFGKNARLASAVVVVFYAVALVAINIAGLRTMIVYILGDSVDISIPLATVLAAATAIAYTALGGLSAVVWTDTVQLVIMIVGIFIIGPILGISMSGGVDNIVNAYADQGMTITNPFEGGVSMGLIGLCLAYILAVPGDPTMPQRVLSAKDTGTAKFAFYACGGLSVYFAVAILIIGGAIFLLMPGIESGDAALPLFIINFYPPVIKGIALAGIMAAIMSSFTSFLILATTHAMYDIGGVIKKDITEKTITKSLPYVTIIVGIVGIVIALYIESLLGYLSMVFSIVGSAFIPVLIAALFFKERTSKVAAVLSIVAGTVVPAALFLTVGYDVFLGDPVFLGIFASTGIIVLGSLVLKDKPSAEEIVSRKER